MRGMPFEAGAPEIVQFFEGKLSLEKVLFHTLCGLLTPFYPMVGWWRVAGSPGLF